MSRLYASPIATAFTIKSRNTYVIGWEHNPTSYVKTEGAQHPVVDRSALPYYLPVVCNEQDGHTGQLKIGMPLQDAVTKMRSGVS